MTAHVPSREPEELLPGLLSDNRLGFTLLSRVLPKVMHAIVPRPGEKQRLRPIPELLAMPCGWGTPEYRLHFVYAEEYSPREARINEYIGADFFELVLYNLDTHVSVRRHYPIQAAEDKRLEELLFTYFLTGATPRADPQGDSCYRAWLDGAPLLQPFLLPSKTYTGTHS